MKEVRGIMRFKLQPAVTGTQIVEPPRECGCYMAEQIILPQSNRHLESITYDEQEGREA